MCSALRMLQGLSDNTKQMYSVLTDRETHCIEVNKDRTQDELNSV